MENKPEKIDPCIEELCKYLLRALCDKYGPDNVEARLNLSMYMMAVFDDPDGFAEEVKKKYFQYHSKKNIRSTTH